MNLSKKEELTVIKHCVVALDAEGRVIGRVPIWSRGNGIDYMYETDDWAKACEVSGYYTEYVLEKGLPIGIEKLRGRYHKPAGFEVVSEAI